MCGASGFIDAKPATAVLSQERQGSESHSFSFDSLDQTMKSETTRIPPLLAASGR
jgi:hypothetical protein